MIQVVDSCTLRVKFFGKIVQDKATLLIYMRIDRSSASLSFTWEMKQDRTRAFLLLPVCAPLIGCFSNEGSLNIACSTPSIKRSQRLAALIVDSFRKKELTNILGVKCIAHPLFTLPSFRWWRQRTASVDKTDERKKELLFFFFITLWMVIFYL